MESRSLANTLRRGSVAQMARLLRISPDGSATTVSDIRQVFDDKPGWLWLDVPVTEVDLVVELSDRFEWDRIEMEDVFDDRPIGKVVDVGSHLFTVFQSVTLIGGRVDTTEVDAFLSERLLVTIRHGTVVGIDDLWEQAGRNHGFREGGPDRMLARLAAAIVVPLLPLVSLLEERVEAVEENAMGRSREVIGQVQALRSDVARLRRFVAPQRDVMQTLSREGSRLVGFRARRRFADVNEQLFRVVESLDAARLLLGAALEIYRSAVAEEMNAVMKVLTVFSAVMLPLTLLAGIWGMNFENMPELQWRWGYPMAVGTMVVVGVGLWWVFGRIGFVSRATFRDLPRAIGLGLWEVASHPLKLVERTLRGIPDQPQPPVDS